jgi:crotonobetainyl-CoA:carnitine CoA-transferase CaiB-like acyl-CoA transferase
MTTTGIGGPSHLRVLDLATDLGQSCGRVFADLGADVVKVEPPDGDPGRAIGPFVGEIPRAERSLSFAHRNRGKRSVVLDLAASSDRERAAALAECVDVLIEDGRPGGFAALGLGYEALSRRNPRLVYVSITAFGQRGLFSRWLGDDLVAQATGGIMYANGDDTRRPAMVPYELISQIACLHAVVGALAALHARRRTGAGQHVDVSRQEVVLYCQGPYISRYSMQHEVARRERLMPMGGVNTYRCRDGGYMNIAPFMAHHLQRLFHDVMQHPVLADDEWSRPDVRRARREEMDAYIAEYMAAVERDEIVERAQRTGVPAIPVLSPQEFVEHPHTQARGFFREVEQPGVGRYRVAGPPALLGATPWRVDRPVPALGEHTDEVLAEIAREAAPAAGPSISGAAPIAGALDGLRVTDFTRAFAGPLATMFLGFFGADVIKVESGDLEDNRQPGQPTFPELNRAKRSCTIDTRTEDGRALVKRLVADSGVVVENFRPGVMERLGLDYEQLRGARPDLVMLSMPGFGNSGPLRDYYSYGQQVMGMTGLTALWGHPESPLDARAKYAFPDYVAAITGAVALLAALEHRERTGEGQYIELSQVEALASLLSVAYSEYTELGRPPVARGNRHPRAAPHDVYPCLGFDAWCAIEVQTDEQWRALVAALGSPVWAVDPRLSTAAGRLEHAAEIDGHLAQWTAARPPRLVATVLQDAGVPAGIVASGEDLYYDPHLRERGMVVRVDHPGFGRIDHAGVNVQLDATPGRADRPAPEKGQDNDYVFGELLGLEAAERERLERAQVLR